MSSSWENAKELGEEVNEYLYEINAEEQEHWAKVENWIVALVPQVDNLLANKSQRVLLLKVCVKVKNKFSSPAWLNDVKHHHRHHDSKEHAHVSWEDIFKQR